MHVLPVGEEPCNLMSVQPMELSAHEKDRKSRLLLEDNTRSVFVLEAVAQGQK